MSSVSIVIPYMPNRGTQLDVTLKSIAAQDFPVEMVLIADIRHRTQKWMNPAPLWNEGVRRATGNILILQSPECQHSAGTIAKLSGVEPKSAMFAAVMALKPDGSNDRWYCHSQHHPMPWFFCGSVHKDMVLAAGGWDESFTDYGGEDINFAGRLEKAGCHFVYDDSIMVYHQWHEFTGGVGV